jgi:hypothetical protein
MGPYYDAKVKLPARFGDPIARAAAAFGDQMYRRYTPRPIAPTAPTPRTDADYWTVSSKFASARQRSSGVSISW